MEFTHEDLTDEKIEICICCLLLKRFVCNILRKIYFRVKSSTSGDPHKCVALMCVCVCVVPAEKGKVTAIKSCFV